MEIGPIVRIPVLPTTAEVPRIEAAKLIRPVRTELPSIAVTETPSSPSSSMDTHHPSPSETVERGIIIDPETQQVIFRAVDTETGEVLRQVPEEIMLRLQAYARAMTLEAGGEASRADRTA